jgi:aldose sugar dehydrogenase
MLFRSSGLLPKRETPRRSICRMAMLLSAASMLFPAAARAVDPSVLPSDLAVRTVVSGLELPTTMAFIGADDMFVLEKSTGKVQRVVGGAVQSTVMDLAVNNASERGLLGIALDPGFASNGFVYLYWTCKAPPPPIDSPFIPTNVECPDQPEFGEDSDDVLAVPLLGNRVDRFVWNGTILTWDMNLIKLRVFQHDGAPDPPGQGDEAQPPRGNHDGGVIRFGPDGKLYIIVGDLGRRGMMQNLASGPTPTGLGPVVPDDQFGGPAPDNAHLSGIVLRLNTDGTAPTNNPFYRFGAAMGGEAGANLQKVFAYGVRNSFGMAFDPISGRLWNSENGDSSFDELNLVFSGFNSGWIQSMGPLSRHRQFREIENTEPFVGLQQLRWPASNIAPTYQEARARMVHLPGAEYSEPEFSWKYATAPAAIGFLNSSALGDAFAGDLFVGFSTPQMLGGPLFRFELDDARRKIVVADARLRDRVADNLEPHDMTESEAHLFGTNFGVVTDIQTGPNGNLYVVSLSNGAVYEIFRP